MESIPITSLVFPNARKWLHLASQYHVTRRSGLLLVDHLCQSLLCRVLLLPGHLYFRFT